MKIIVTRIVKEEDIKMEEFRKIMIETILPMMVNNGLPISIPELPAISSFLIHDILSRGIKMPGCEENESKNILAGISEIQEVLEEMAKKKTSISCQSGEKCIIVATTDMGRSGFFRFQVTA